MRRTCQPYPAHFSLNCKKRAAELSIEMWPACRCSPVCLVMAFAYMRRLGAVDPLLQVSHMNVHRQV
jgi:hypothetical protein